jgi:hypothetical protein
MDNLDKNTLGLFAIALSMLLNENEGIVVNTSEEAEFAPDPDVDKVIVFQSGDQIRIIPCDRKDLEEGELVWMFEDNPN